ncbi:T-cell immunomodulatory protein isoform X1 [Nematostella vectensis]|nr:T-cell immunomodulatory protein isoform X1 [Nematostella vectensis]
MLFPFLSCFLFIYYVQCSFIDVTDKIGIAGIDGILAAFGDFDGDKQNDFFVITNGGSSLEIFLWQGSQQKFRKSKANIHLSNRSERIVNAAPGDYDEDGCMDVVITIEPKEPSHLHSQPKKVYVFWGNQDKFSQFSTNESVIGEQFADQPTVLDVNGDFVPDLFGTKYDAVNQSIQIRNYWISEGRNRKFYEVEQTANDTSSEQPRPLTLDPIRSPHSNAFLDLSGDMVADLVVTSQRQNKEYKFEIWEDKEGVLVLNHQSVELPNDIKTSVHHVGQSSFADIDADGSIDMLVPVCMDASCKKSHIYLYSKSKWAKILSNDKDIWEFISPSSNLSRPDIPLMVLRTGDYNMDGYPDVLMIVNVVMSDQKKSIRQIPVLLENVPCPDRDNGKACAEGRTFNIQWKVWSLMERSVLATFVDLFENGITDFMIVTEDGKTPGKYHLHAIRNDIFLDASFLKIIVLGGELTASCSDEDKLPYGVNQAGPFIAYTTTDTNGQTKQGSAAQLSQSAYFALQCPYTVFGLGQTPNFVDKLTIGMPRAKNSPMRTHSWPSIIPNSQMIVIPYPPNQPNKWKSMLLVTPSKLLLLTGLSLLGICAFIGLIILALHLKEKRADQKEKRQDAHKFHFDAM